MAQRPELDMGPLPESVGESLAERICQLIEANPSHQWSLIPCAMCYKVSSLLGRPFGCHKMYMALSNKMQARSGSTDDDSR